MKHLRLNITFNDYQASAENGDLCIHKHCSHNGTTSGVYAMKAMTLFSKSVWQNLRTVFAWVSFLRLSKPCF